MMMMIMRRMSFRIFEFPEIYADKNENLRPFITKILLLPLNIFESSKKELAAIKRHGHLLLHKKGTATKTKTGWFLSHHHFPKNLLLRRRRRESNSKVSLKEGRKKESRHFLFSPFPIFSFSPRRIEN